MTDPIVSVRNLYKAYRVYSHPSKMVAEVLTGRPHHREFVALEDISFDVQPGTVVGLLGRNGAGKSTLLRIVARTLDASSGTVMTRGRIAAILELGTGFHLDYTGRENIYFGGICLGLSRREMHERVDEIIAFSELEQFIDQPFRTYSSGMQARLTFSVATCVDPDILIVDEALAVGDAKFQLKSFDRIREFKRRGKAILLVSHSINQITAFCDYAILLDHGRMLAEGDPNRVGNIYHELLFGPDSRGLQLTDPKVSEVPVSTPPAETGSELDPPLPTDMRETAGQSDFAAPEFPVAVSNGQDNSTADACTKLDDVEQSLPLESAGELTAEREYRYGNGDATIVAAEIRDLQGRPHGRLRSLETYEIYWTIAIHRPVSDMCFGILLRDARGIDLFGADSYNLSGLHFGPQKAGMRIVAKTRFRANLAAGMYFLTLALANPDQTKYDLRFDAIELIVEPTLGMHDSSLINLEVHFSSETQQGFAPARMPQPDRQPLEQHA